VEISVVVKGSVAQADREEKPLACPFDRDRVKHFSARQVCDMALSPPPFLRVKRVKRQRTFARTRNARDDDEFLLGQHKVNVFEVVLTGTTNDDVSVTAHRQYHRKNFDAPRQADKAAQRCL